MRGRPGVLLVGIAAVRAAPLALGDVSADVAIVVAALVGRIGIKAHGQGVIARRYGSPVATVAAQTVVSGLAHVQVVVICGAMAGERRVSDVVRLAVTRMVF